MKTQTMIEMHFYQSFRRRYFYGLDREISLSRLYDEAVLAAEPTFLKRTNEADLFCKNSY